MSNGHFEKWIFKTIVGLVLIAGGFFFMYYTLVHFYEENWVLHAVISSVGVAAGAFFLSSASINKVKSDLIRKQKAREQSG